MVLVVHDSAVGDIREIEEFELDIAFGSDENALKLEARSGEAPEEGQFVFIDGTEYGGVIDQASYEAGREPRGQSCARAAPGTASWLESACFPIRAAATSP